MGSAKKKLVAKLHSRSSSTQHFVGIAEDGTHFTIRDHHPFYIAGANCPSLVVRHYIMCILMDTTSPTPHILDTPHPRQAMAASPGKKKHVLAVLDATAAAGLTVLRVFAFADGPGGLQQAPGEFNEDWYRALDYVLHEAGERGLRLILVLTNYAPEGGGMKVLRQWSCVRRGVEPVDDTADAFFTDPACQDLFKTAMVKLVDRENSINHILYR